MSPRLGRGTPDIQLQFSHSEKIPAHTAAGETFTFCINDVRELLTQRGAGENLSRGLRGPEFKPLFHQFISWLSMEGLIYRSLSLSTCKMRIFEFFSRNVVFMSNRSKCLKNCKIKFIIHNYLYDCVHNIWRSISRTSVLYFSLEILGSLIFMPSCHPWLIAGTSIGTVTPLFPFFFP